MELFFSILNIPLWLILVFGLILIYLIVKRFEARKKEDFEDRDN